MMLLGLINQKGKLKYFNALQRKPQIMEYYSYVKLIPLMTLSSINMKILRVDCFFHINYEFLWCHNWIFR